jgi:membrane protein involved in colicin uptake
MTDKQNDPAWAAPPSGEPAPAFAQPPSDTDEQKAALQYQKEQEAAAKKAEKEALKAQKDAEKQAAKEAKDAQKQAKQAEKEAAKKAKADAIAAKNAEKANKLKEREQSKQPEQNGVRRPKPEGECGKAWALFDQLSAAKGAPVAAAEIRAELAKGSELNEGNVKAEYPRWKKFHGLSGTIPPAAPLAPPAQPQAAA